MKTALLFLITTILSAQVTVSVVWPLNNQNVASTTVLITGSSTTTVGSIASTQYSVDGGSYTSVPSPVTSWYFTVNANALTAGAHTVMVKSTDTSSNTSTSGITINAVRTTPTCSHTLKANNIYCESASYGFWASQTSQVYLALQERTQGTYFFLW